MKSIDLAPFLGAVEAALEKRVSGLTPDTRFRDLPEWDSLASVLMAAEVHADYGVQISGEELAECQTLAELKELIERKL